MSLRQPHVFQIRKHLFRDECEVVATNIVVEPNYPGLHFFAEQVSC